MDPRQTPTRNFLLVVDIHKTNSLKARYVDVANAEVANESGFIFRIELGARIGRSWRFWGIKLGPLGYIWGVRGATRGAWRARRPARREHVWASPVVRPSPCARLSRRLPLALVHRLSIWACGGRHGSSLPPRPLSDSTPPLVVPPTVSKMVSTTKGLFLALLATVSSGAVVANAAACTGTSDLDIPYSISSTRTGDGKSTSFLGLVCGLGCSDGQLCEDVSSVSVGGVSLGGGDSSDDCGTVFNVALQPDGGCETFTFTTGQSNVDLESVCPNGCHVRFNFANGESVVRTIGGGRVETTPVASPPPVPVVPDVTVSPSAASPELSPSPMEPSPGGTVTPSANNSPRPYGSMRRRGRQMLQDYRRL